MAAPHFTWGVTSSLPRMQQNLPFLPSQSSDSNPWSPLLAPGHGRDRPVDRHLGENHGLNTDMEVCSLLLISYVEQRWRFCFPQNVHMTPKLHTHVDTPENGNQRPTWVHGCMIPNSSKV